jgi:hypothetical protein
VNVIFRRALYGVDQYVGRNKGQGINRWLVTAAARTLFQDSRVSLGEENVAMRRVYVLTLPVSPANLHFTAGLN